VGDNWLRVNVAGVAPTIAIPTTAGTGSEVGRASLIIDEEDHRKVIIFHPSMLPRLVLADPELTTGLPAHLTAATGIDAFVHNFEAYCSPFYHPLAQGVALEGMKLVHDWLPAAYADGGNIEARSQMLAASIMGATAFQKGLGGVHALAHPIGAVFDTHHGLANAILLPYVMVRNRPAIADRLTAAARYIGLADCSFDGFLAWILALRIASPTPWGRSAFRLIRLARSAAWPRPTPAMAAIRCRYRRRTTAPSTWPQWKAGCHEAPLIGLTTYPAGQGYGYHTPVDYVHAVVRAGGVPVLLPPVGKTAIDSWLAVLDGVVLIGGGDIAPCAV
jgi:hypothetical protein